MHPDARMVSAGERLLDARRLIIGCFEPIVSMGRDEARDAALAFEAQGASGLLRGPCPAPLGGAGRLSGAPARRRFPAAPPGRRRRRLLQKGVERAPEGAPDRIGLHQDLVPRARDQEASPLWGSPGEGCGRLVDEEAVLLGEGHENRDLQGLDAP
jgi:hypothetical protein